jgi:hypothetical protein
MRNDELIGAAFEQVILQLELVAVVCKDFAPRLDGLTYLRFQPWDMVV